MAQTGPWTKGLLDEAKLQAASLGLDSEKLVWRWEPEMGFINIGVSYLNFTTWRRLANRKINVPQRKLQHTLGVEMTKLLKVVKKNHG